MEQRLIDFADNMVASAAWLPFQKPAPTRFMTEPAVQLPAGDHGTGLSLHHLGTCLQPDQFNIQLLRLGVEYVSSGLKLGTCPARWQLRTTTWQQVLPKGWPEVMQDQSRGVRLSSLSM